MSINRFHPLKVIYDALLAAKRDKERKKIAFIGHDFQGDMIVSDVHSVSL